MTLPYSRFDPYEHGDYLDVAECAERMQLSRAEIRDLARRRVLRSIDLGGILLVQPAVVTGAVGPTP